jgi:peptide/nickel transport system permease protein
MQNTKLTLGLFTLGLVLFLALAGPTIGRLMFPGANPLSLGAYKRWEAPSPEHPLGTDDAGRDAVVVVLNAIWPSLAIGLVAGATALALGVTIGFVSGYAGGRVDTALRTVIDMVLVIPSLPIFLILAAYIRRWDLVSMSLLLGLFGWPYVARVIRAQVISMRERPYTDLARISGENSLEIIFLELLPNLLPYLGFSLAGAAVGAMLTEAGLQVIGLGARGLPTLGYMIGQGLGLGVMGAGLYGQMLVPIAILILIFLSFNLINMGLEEKYNPRLRTTVEEQ